MLVGGEGSSEMTSTVFMADDSYQKNHHLTSPGSPKYKRMIIEPTTKLDSKIDENIALININNSFSSDDLPPKDSKDDILMSESSEMQIQVRL